MVTKKVPSDMRMVDKFFKSLFSVYLFIVIVPVSHALQHIYLHFIYAIDKISHHSKVNNSSYIVCILF